MSANPKDRQIGILGEKCICYQVELQRKLRIIFMPGTVCVLVHFFFTQRGWGGGGQ